MKLLLFSLKKTLRTPLYWIFLAGILLLPPLFYHVGRATAAPPAAYHLEDPQDPDSALIGTYLDRAGFTAYASEEELRRDVSLGLTEGGVLVGYVPRRYAAVMARLMDAGKALSAKVTEKSLEGHWLDLAISIDMKEV